MELYDSAQKIQRFSELRQHAMWFCTGTKAASEKRRYLAKAENENELREIVKKEFGL
jgi:tRNA-dihydrouridine synthase